MEELKKVFNVMCIIGVEIVELVAYQLKSVARTWYDQWNEGRDENAPHLNLAYFEEALLGCSFPENKKRPRYMSSLP